MTIHLRTLFGLAAALLTTSHVALAESTDVIRSMQYSEARETTTIRLQGNKKPTFTVYRLRKPPRVVVEVSGAKLSSKLGAMKTHQLNTWAVGNVSLRDVKGQREVVRLTVNLARTAAYRISADETSVVLRITAKESLPTQDRIEKHEATQRLLERELAEARSRLTVANKELSNTRSALRDSKSQDSKKQAAAQRDVNRAESKQAEALARLNRLQTRLGELEKSKQALRAKHKTLGKQHKTLDRKHKTLDRKHKTLVARHKTTESERNRLARERADLEKRSRALERRNAELRAKNARLAKQAEIAESNATKMKSRANKFEKQTTSLAQKAKQLEKQNERLASSLSKVEKERRAAKQATEKMTQKLDSLRKARNNARKSGDKMEITRLEKELQQTKMDKAKQDQRLQIANARLVKLEKQQIKNQNTLAPQRRNVSVRIRNVDYRDTRSAASVLVEMTGPARARIVSQSKQQAVLEIPSTYLPERYRRTLDVRKYRGPIRAISSFVSPRDPSKSRIVVDLTRPVKPVLNRLGNTLSLDFAKTSPVVTSQVTRINASTIAQQQVTSFANTKRRVYRGKRIDFDFRDADIHNLLRTLAGYGGVNIVIPDTIRHRVTVRLRKVPWDQAFEVILASKGLWYKKEGPRIYRIDDRKKLEQEAAQIAAAKEAARNAEDPEIEIFTLNYADAANIKTQLKSLKSKKGNIEVNDRTNSLIISDISRNRKDMIALVRKLDTPTPQIQIEARIVEARSTFVRDIGIQWGGSSRNSPASGNATGLTFPSRFNVAGGNVDAASPTGGIVGDPSPTSPDFLVNMPAATGLGSGGAIGFSLGSISENFGLNFRLSALEDQGTVRIVSAPKIKVLNNEQATITQGVQIPISQVAATGVQTTFVNANLQLQVKPHVSQRDCTIAMDLLVTKNEADFANVGARGDPTILQKEAKTKLLVADGETSVVGGIYTRNSGLAYSKVPFLGDIPVLGWLFKKRRENDERTEMLIFVTPKITNKAFLRCE